MKALIIAVLLACSLPYAMGEITLESRLTDLSFARNEDFHSLVTEFIILGQFGTGYPYNPVFTDKKTVQAFTECIDSEFNTVYSAYGYDTQVGTLFLGCAYKLGWFDR